MVIPQPRVFPKCPKCDNKTFESQTHTFKKTNVLIIYCSVCGAVQGIANAK